MESDENSNSTSTFKRKRTLNFTNQEKLLLINIVNKYKGIIENKKTDAVGIKEKNNAWEKITTEFNSSGLYCSRSMECLKRCYENKKKQIRRQSAEERRQLYKTGGGMPNVVKKDPCDELFLSIVNKKSVEGLKNQFDCDVILPKTSVHDLPETLEHASENEIEFVFVEENESELDQNKQTTQNTVFKDVDKTLLKKNDKNDTKTNWQKYTAQNLKSPVDVKLQSNRRRPTSTVVKALTTNELAQKYDTLLNRRLEIANLQKEQIGNQIKHEREQNILETNLMVTKKTEIEDQIKRENEAHKLKMELLKAQIDYEKLKVRKFEQFD